MDQLTACQILDIEPDSSREEIMEAYAGMVKRYHPEEYPMEFAQIQEAYRLLMKGKRRRRARQTEDAEIRVFDISEGAKNQDTGENQGAAKDRDTGENQENGEKETGGTFDFLETRFREVDYKDELRQQEEEARRKEEIARREALLLEKKREEEENQRREQEAVQCAAQYLENILRDPSMSGKPEIYSKYFLNHEVQEIMDSRRYIRALLGLLEKYPQKQKIYRLIRNIYQSRPEDVLTRRLLIFLNEKLGTDTAQTQKLPVSWYVILVIEIYHLIQSARKENLLVCIFSFFVVDVILIGYRRMRRNYSFRVSQIFASLELLVMMTVCLLGEIFNVWTNVGGFDLMLVFWILCSCWLIILGIWSVITGIRDWRARKKSRSTQ